MPHFRDGTEVKIGMRVRGVGYNSDAKGYSRTHGIEGIVVGVNQGEDKPGACTLDVVFLRAIPVAQAGGGYVAWLSADGATVLVPTLEHGDTVGFELVGKAAGG